MTAYDIYRFLMEVKDIPYWDRVPAVSDEELDKMITYVEEGFLSKP